MKKQGLEPAPLRLYLEEPPRLRIFRDESDDFETPTTILERPMRDEDDEYAAAITCASALISLVLAAALCLIGLGLGWFQATP